MTESQGANGRQDRRGPKHEPGGHFADQDAEYQLAKGVGYKKNAPEKTERRLVEVKGLNNLIRENRKDDRDQNAQNKEQLAATPGNEIIGLHWNNGDAPLESGVGQLQTMLVMFLNHLA